jgi:catechol 2,3-dioxygenase-like lactoylglutathione lyase family enzyme
VGLGGGACDNGAMSQSIGQIALVVRDYDEAIEFYVGVLGFALVEDTPIPAQAKRWVVVAPPGANSCRLLLARAVGDEQSSRIGNQSGGRVFLAVFKDLYGNLWDLVERCRPSSQSGGAIPGCTTRS